VQYYMGDKISSNKLIGDEYRLSDMVP